MRNFAKEFKLIAFSLACACALTIYVDVEQQKKKNAELPLPPAQEVITLGEIEIPTTEPATEATTVEETTTQVETTTKVETTTAAPKPQITAAATYKEDEYGKYYTMIASITAYCPCKKCCGKYANNRPVDENGEPIIYTASGARAKPNYTLGMSSRYAFGTKVYIPGVGICEVQDRGGAVKGNVIDLYCATHEEACKWGRKSVEVKIYV